MQKILTVASAALSVVALAVVLLSSREPAPVPAAPQPSAQAQGELRALERRVELLEEANGLLER